MEIKRKIRALLSDSLFHNVVALYGLQFCRKLMPLVSLPYLTRVLHPAGWGTVAFVGSLGEFLVLVIEFGFNLSATRELAQQRQHKDYCGRLVSGVIASQLLLATVGVGAVMFAARFIPVLNTHPLLLMAGVLYGVSQGMNPIWFFQGLENIRLAAGIEIGGKVAGVVGMFLLVKVPGDDWKVLLLQAVPAIFATSIGYWLASRTVRLARPTWAHVRQTLTSAWPMFMYRSGESLYAVGNAFVLGLFASIDSVGYFSLAEKLARAIFGLLNPIREAWYPRLSNLASKSWEDTAKMAQTGAFLMIGGGVLLGIGIYVFAPLLITVAGSRGFSPAISVLRIFALLPPLLSVTYSVGLQWLLPFGKDWIVNRIVISAGILNLLLAFVLAPRYTHFGMAWSVVVSELFVCVSLVFAVMRMTAAWKSSSVKLGKALSLAGEQNAEG